MWLSKELAYLNNNKAKVCIIGAGAAGLCAIRNFRKYEHKFDIEVFEKTNSVGGTWVYNELSDKDEFGLPIHSSVYANLKTNIPMHVMEFLDFDCTKNREEFVNHQNVLFYLEQYAKDSDAYKYIKFNHLIKKVKRDANRWNVQIRNLKTGEEFTRFYDVVLVCNGRFSRPSIPKSCDLTKFKGKILHSHHYRRPENFKDERVVILGAGPSGLDISLELVGYSKQIYLLHQLDKNFKDLPDVIIQLNDWLKSADDKTIYTINGLELNNIDTIIFSTGYDYDHDFLDENCGVKLEKNGKLTNIYLHLLNSLYPTMCILAIPQRILPFPMYHQQINWYLKYLTGELQLPSKEEMDRYEKEDFDKRIKNGFKMKHSHKMVTEQHLWDYEELITKQANLPRINKAKRDCFNSLHKLRSEYAASYKNWKYNEINDEQYELK